MKRYLQALLKFVAQFAALLVASVLLIVAYVWLTGPPYDATLERDFVRRESDLQQLVLMTQQDKHLVRIAPDFTWLDIDASWPRANVGLTTERWNRYRDLFQQVGLPVGIIGGADGEILFPVYHAGFVPAGFSKGYVYSEKPPAPEVSSLNTMPTNIGPKYSDVHIAFKPIKKDWYIYRFED